MSGKKCDCVEMSVDDKSERVYMNEWKGAWMKRQSILHFLQTFFAY